MKWLIEAKYTRADGISLEWVRIENFEASPRKAMSRFLTIERNGRAVGVRLRLTALDENGQP